LDLIELGKLIFKKLAGRKISPRPEREDTTLGITKLHFTENLSKLIFFVLSYINTQKIAGALELKPQPQLDGTVE
jgi:hypothetical protein